MDIWRQKADLYNKATDILEKKFGSGRFVTWAIVDENPAKKSRAYFTYLKRFHFLFDYSEEMRIHLWNTFYAYGDSLNNLDRNDFSKEENEFLDEIVKVKKEHDAKYGDKESNQINVNKIETERLLLVPFDDELNNIYIEFLRNNPKEFELYYGTDFIEDDLVYCNQRNRQLSFAILLKDTKEFIGAVALDLKRNDSTYNLEYFIIPQFRGNGYAFESINSLIEKAKNKEIYGLIDNLKFGYYDEVKLNILCIEAITGEDNKASKELLKKLKFNFDGKVPYYKKVKEKYYTYDMYHLILE